MTRNVQDLLDRLEQRSSNGRLWERPTAPLGGLPRARLGIRAGAAGLVLHPDARLFEEARALPEAVRRLVVVEVATPRGTSWAVRVRGNVPSQVQPWIGHMAPVYQLDARTSSTPLPDLLPGGPYLAIPARIPVRDFLNVATYDGDILPLSSLVVISDETLTTLGWLSSRAFWLWMQVVAQAKPGATTLLAYNTFPAPALKPSQRRRLETAVDTVLASRSYLMTTSLGDLYANMPPQLRDAHEKLDAVVEDLLGLPEGAPDLGVMEHLIAAYEELAAA